MALSFWPSYVRAEVVRENKWEGGLARTSRLTCKRSRDQRRAENKTQMIWTNFRPTFTSITLPSYTERELRERLTASFQRGKGIRVSLEATYYTCFQNTRPRARATCPHLQISPSHHPSIIYYHPQSSCWPTRTKTPSSDLNRKIRSLCQDL